MNSQQSLVLSVSRNVAHNPIARAIERRRLQQWFTATSLEMLSTPDGKESSALICGVAEALAIAIKTTEGWDDPEDVGGALIGAMDLALQMSQAGYRWQAQHAQTLCDALDLAIQLLCGMQPAEKLRAWAWAQQVNRKAAAEAAAA